MTLLLGRYGELSSPLYLYSYKSNYFMCLDDINYVFLNQQLYTKSSLIKDIYVSNSADFLKETSSGRLFVSTQILILIARLFHCYTLAELCKLTSHEILGNVAEPLFQSIQCDRWLVATSVPVERIILHLDSVSGDEFDVAASPTITTTTTTTTKEKELLLFQFPTDKPKDHLHAWLSSTVYNKEPATLECLLESIRTKKQQEAIIDTRTRKIAFRQRTIAGNTSSSSPLHKKPTKLPPSPPPFHFKKRQYYHHHHHLHEEDTKRQKSSHYVYDHGTDNLTLLATQAIQSGGLPLSPEVSPSPPPLFGGNSSSHAAYRLPSLKSMLSGLPPHHHFRYYDKRDSCA